MVNIGDIFPNFEAETTIGSINFYDWLENSWGLLISYSADFKPVCTSELAQVVRLKSEFKRRGVKVIALSCDSVKTHKKWLRDIKVLARCLYKKFPFPIIADEKRELAFSLQIIDPDEVDVEGRVITARAVYVIDPKKKTRLSVVYSTDTERNFGEILRHIDSLKLSDNPGVSTTVDYVSKNDVMVQRTVSDDDIEFICLILIIFALFLGKNLNKKTP